MGRPCTDIAAAIGLGSNLGDRAQHLRFGLEGLRRRLNGVRVSSVFCSAPRHVTEQPRFLNACCVGRTGLGPLELLSVLQDLERAAGRRSGGVRRGPRVLDLDLLLYGDEALELPDLVIPHPLMRERAFVLLPLREIAAGWWVPGAGKWPGATVEELAAAVSTDGVERTNLRLEDA